MTKHNGTVFFASESRWLPFLLITLAIAVVYGKALAFGYVDYDDTRLIVDNQEFIKDLSNFFSAFTKDVFNVNYYGSSKSYYRPLLTVSFMLDAQFGGPAPFVYHLSSFLYHIAATCLLFALLKRMHFRPDLSLLLVMLFAVHPVFSQAVAWIPGRNDSLLAIFVLMSMIFYLKAEEGGKCTCHLLSILFMLCALLVKESAVGLIALLFLHQLLLGRDRTVHGKKILVVSGWIITALLWLGMRTLVVQNTSVTMTGIINSIWTNLGAMPRYIGKIFFPVNLSVFPILKDVPLVYGIVSLSILALAIVLSKKEKSAMTWFGTAWFVLFLLPSLISIQPGDYSKIFEHRVYLPAMGLIIVLLSTEFVNGIDLGKPAPLAVFAAITLLFGSLSFLHIDAMKNPLKFWQNAVATSPNSSVAHLNLGSVYTSMKMFRKSEEEFKTTLKLNALQPMAHNNLGRIYAIQGLLGLAEQEFKKELALFPEYDDALYNLGMVSYDTGKVAEAIHYWQETLNINAYHIKANYYLTSYYYQQGDLASAQLHLNRLLARGVKIQKDQFPGLHLTTH